MRLRIRDGKEGQRIWALRSFLWMYRKNINFVRIVLFRIIVLVKKLLDFHSGDAKLYLAFIKVLNENR